MKNKLVLLVALVGLLMGCKQSTEKLESPDGSIQVMISNKDGLNKMAVTVEGDTVIASSLLGLKVNDNDFTVDVAVEKVSQSGFDERWETVNGKYPVIRNHYNEYRLTVSNIEVSNTFYEIVFRLYNDGFAYRYLLPEELAKKGVKIDELTSLNFKDDFTYWAYNGEHHNVGPIKRSQEAVEEVRIPIVIETESKRYMAIHEAEILEFGPFSIDASGENGSLRFNIDYSERNTAFQTSWRAFMIGEKIGDLVESNLLVNLNKPCKIEDTSWIKPGKSLWDWRVWGYKTEDGYEYGLNTDSHKRFIDFASENNIQYLLIDADWYGAEFSQDSDPTSSREGIDIEECLRYADSKNVGVILYLNDVGAKKFGLERVLKQFSDWGAKGVKYGFMKGTDEEKVAQTRKVVELCAKYKLMVNFHDNPIPPSGDRRTWPNLVVKEYCHAQADGHRSYFPETAVNMPLINMIAGPLDVTNGWFDLNSAHSRERVFEEIPGTVAAEVAKQITIYTGWMVLPDAPEEYLKKDDLFDCIRKMPPQFDDFKVLDAQLDEFVSIVRKAGDDWFVGSLTTRDAREITIDFSFLPEGIQFHATLYEDTPATHFLENKEAYQVRDEKVDSNSKLKIRMAPGGGHAIYLTPIE